MNRRALLTAAGGSLLAGGGVIGVSMIGGNKETANNTTSKENVTDEAPQVVRNVQPLAATFRDHIDDYFDSVRVFITQNGEIVMQYSTTAETESALKSEMHRIAKEYATIVKEGHQPVSLTIVTGKVQGIIPTAAIKAYVRGDINEEAYHETLQVTGIETNEN